ncbi:MAG: hypothetical protein M1830_006108 [Pleopsidium flavum]|nr:MAG: hypothetical protein M1830_006108 [Pleopsidium flavum]
MPPPQISRSTLSLLSPLPSHPFPAHSIPSKPKPPTNPPSLPGVPNRQYFTLSKTHHPDHNPNDPSSSSRFVKIAEAYAILGSPSKRQHYDHLHHHHHHSSHSPTTPHSGSHHSRSSSAFGARPASGLSKRRTQFRGPPASFYRSGGWGAHGAKRAAQAEAAASASASASASSTASSASSSSASSPGTNNAGGGFGGFGGAAMGWENDVPHFHRDGHFRTQEQQEIRRRRRMAEEEGVGFENGGSLLINFLFVAGIISLAIVLPTLFGRKVVKRRKEDLD